MGGGVGTVRPTCAVPPSTTVTSVSRVSIASTVLPRGTLQAVRGLSAFGGGVIGSWRAPVLSVKGRSIRTVMT